MSNDEGNADIEEMSSDRLGLIRELSRIGVTAGQAGQSMRAAFSSIFDQMGELSRLASPVSEAVVVPEMYSGGELVENLRGVALSGDDFFTPIVSSTSFFHGFQVGRHELPGQGKRFYDKLCKSSKWGESSSLFFKTGSRFVYKHRPFMFVELFPAKYIGGWYKEETDTLEWISKHSYSKNIYDLLGYWLIHSPRRKKESNLPLAMDEVASDNFIKELEEVIENGEDVLHPAFHTRAIIRREPKEVLKKIRYIRV